MNGLLVPRKKSPPSTVYCGFQVETWNYPIERPGAYLFTNTINGKQYVGIAQDVAARVGKHRYSGHLICKAIKKYGASAFRVEPLFYSLNGTKELPLIEAALIIAYDTIAPNGYNIIRNNGAVGPYGEVFGAIVSAAKGSPESVAKIRLTSLSKLSDPTFRAMWIAVTQAALTPEVIVKRGVSIGKALSKPEWKAQKAADISCRIWISNGRECRRIRNTDPIPEGWKRGREGGDTNLIRGDRQREIMREVFNRPEVRQKLGRWQQGTRWITNDRENKRIPSGQSIPEGWRYGKTDRK